MGFQDGEIVRIFRAVGHATPELFKSAAEKAGDRHTSQCTPPPASSSSPTIGDMQVAEGCLTEIPTCVIKTKTSLAAVTCARRTGSRAAGLEVCSGWLQYIIVSGRQAGRQMDRRLDDWMTE